MTPHATIHRPLFVERLSKVLSEADFPKLPGDRAADFARIFDLDVITSERIIDGLTLPSENLLSSIAKEFEVSPEWLSGQG